MTRKVLITGGAGFIGSHVADLFLARDHAVDIIDDLSSGKRENVASAATLHVADVRSPEASTIIREGEYDAILHFAAQMDVRRSVADPLFDASVNIMGTLNLLESLRGTPRAKRTRFVFVSTGGAVYGDLASPPNGEGTPKEPDSPYAISKLASEYYMAYAARIHGMETAALRFANVYGPRQDAHGEAGVVSIFCGRILDGQPLRIFGDGEQTRDYVYVGDVAQSAFLAATAALPPVGGVDARSFNIGTAVETSVLDLANKLREQASSNVPLEFLPKRPGESQRSVLRVDKARALLGWTPATSLNEGLGRTFQWFAERAKVTGSSRS